MRLERRTTRDSSLRRIMRLVPVFILKTHNETNYKCLPKFVQTDNASSVEKRPMNEEAKVGLTDEAIAIVSSRQKN